MNKSKIDEEPTIRTEIEERGNGLPSVGDYVPGNDGNLYVIENISDNILVSGSGRGNRVIADVSLADYNDAEGANAFPASVLIVSDWEI